MLKLSQEFRQTRIDTPLGDDVLLLQHFRGTESLSSDFAYEATVVSEDSAIDGQSIIGKQISVCYFSEDQTCRYFNGFVSKFEFTEQLEEPEKLTSYNLTMVPWIWFLKHNQDCQIFQDMTAPNIIKQIFQELGFNDFRLNLTENYTTREYCVQYRETDFNFVSRLMEEEGIFYYFEHTKDKHTLVMCDSPSGYFQLDESDVQYTPIGQSHEKQLLGWRHVYEFRPGKIAQKDFNFKKPTDALVTDKTSKVNFEGNSKLEIYEYPGRYVEPDKGDRLTKVRMEELESEHDYVVSGGSYLSFSPGGKFNVAKHCRPGEEGKSYALVEVTTEFNSNFGFGNSESEDFKNEFRCIPAETAFRPSRTTSKPIVEGPQTAIIVTDGQEIVVDEHARVKVQFHWDRYGKKDIGSSCWIRVSQVHAGKGWGMIDIPRQHEEVIVSFLDGDPDRPIITGRVYNGDNKPPYELKGAGNNSKHKKRRGNTTKSYEANGYNEITMDDTADQEQIRVHGQHNMDTTIENDETLTVHHDRTKTIDNDETTSVGNHRTETVHKGNETVTVEKGDRSINVNTGSNTMIVQKNKSVVVKSGNSSSNVEKGNHSVTAKKEVQITGLDKIVAIGTNEVSISGKKILISASQEISIGVGSNSIVINQQGISSGGVKITSAAVGVHEISGALIKIN